MENQTNSLQLLRLTGFEVQSIKKWTLKYFGKWAQVRLFGSRIDSNAKGGDIDLYISDYNVADPYDAKIKFLISVQSEIGEQKIDVVIAKDSERDIERSALSQGVLL